MLVICFNQEQTSRQLCWHCKIRYSMGRDYNGGNMSCNTVCRHREKFLYAVFS